MPKVKVKTLKEEIEKHVPRFMVDAEMLPAIKDWEVGEEYELKMRVKQAHVTADENGFRAGFEVLKVIPAAKNESESSKFADNDSLK